MMAIEEVRIRLFARHQIAKEKLPFQKEVHLSWENIELFQKQSLSSEYFVSWKFNSVRCLIHCDFNGNCYAIFQDERMINKIVEKFVGIAKKHCCFILDAEAIEIIADETKKSYYFCKNVVRSQLTMKPIGSARFFDTESFIKDIQLPNVIFKSWFSVAMWQQMLALPPPYPSR